MAFSWDAQSLRAAIDDPGLSFAALQVANQGSGRHELTGAEAVAFFTESGLPQEALSQIWMTSTKGAPEMGPQMFLEALKLAYDALHGGQSSSQMMAGASSSGMAPPAPPSASSFGAPPSGPTPEERQKYSAHYGTLPGANSQQVSLPDAAEFLSKAKIKRELIEQILVKNTRGSGAVTLDAFVQSMHETYEARKAKKEKKGDEERGEGGDGVRRVRLHPQVASERFRVVEVGAAAPAARNKHSYAARAVCTHVVRVRQL